MKRQFLSIAMMAFAALAVSCSSDDDSGGGGAVNPPVLANLFATSNTSSTIANLQFTPQGIVVSNFSTSSNDNQGIYYDDDKDELVVGSRTQKVLNIYTNIENTAPGGTLNLALSTGTVLDSPRDLVKTDDFYIVSDDTDLDGDPSTDEGRFFIFKRDDSGYVLRNTVSVDFAVWGIELIGNDLYAAVDKTGNLAQFKNFLANHTTNSVAVPDKTITIEGIARIHGIAYDNGYVVLSDIGDPSNESDGGIHYLNSFVAKFEEVPNGGTLPILGKQVRIAGRLTELGNPVAVAYDDDRKVIFVAERANENGKILMFQDVGAGGELLPAQKIPFVGASSLYFED